MAPRKQRRAAEEKTGGATYAAGAFIPLKQRRRLNYCDRVSLDAGTGTTSQYFFSCNSLFDPDRTGTGHQPMGFDEIMPLYDHYAVVRSRMHVQVVPTATAGTSADTERLIVSLSLRDTATSVADPTRTIEVGRCAFDVLGSGYGGNAKVCLGMECDMAKTTGVPNVLSEKALWGSVDSDPSEETFFCLSVASLDPSADAPAVQALVTIEYDAFFVEPRPLTQS